MKRIFTGLLLALFAFSAYAEVGQIWRMVITHAGRGEVSTNMELAEVKFYSVSGGQNVVDLIKFYNYTQTTESNTWVIDHNMNVQSVSVDVVDAEQSVVIPTDVVANTRNRVTLTFSEAIAGAATIKGVSLNTPAADTSGRDVPPVEGLENRVGSAAFDNNSASWYVTNRAPTISKPVHVQYTFWIGDKLTWPNIVEYSVTAKKGLKAPATWTLEYYKDGKWVLLDQRAGQRFDDGETKAFDFNMN